MSKKYRELDKLFSQFIRERAMKRVGGCERCLSKKETYKKLQCSHFHGRRKASVRFDEDNGAGLCGSCHLYLTANPLEHIEWQRERLGDRFFDLNIRARTPQKVDVKLLTIYYKLKIEEEK